MMTINYNFNRFKKDIILLASLENKDAEFYACILSTCALDLKDWRNTTFTKEATLREHFRGLDTFINRLKGVQKKRIARDIIKISRYTSIN